MLRKDVVDTWLNCLGLALIVLYTALASIFLSEFAEVNIRFAALPFPIFIGEMVLAACLVIFITKFFIGKCPPSGPALLWGVLYFGWLGARIAWDYNQDGQLALRNAALFYYPVFAVFAYNFYQPQAVGSRHLSLFALFLGGALFLKFVGDYFWFTYAVLFLITVCNFRVPRARLLGVVLLGLVLLGATEYIYRGSRSNLVGISGAALFLLCYFTAILMRRRNFVLVSAVAMTVVVFCAGMFTFSSRSAIVSLSQPRQISLRFRECNDWITSLEPYFEPRVLSAQLYNSDASPGQPQINLWEDIPERGIALPGWQEARRKAQLMASKRISTDEVTEALTTTNTTSFPEMRADRPLEEEKANILFRLFIWRDMAVEMWKNKMVWGFSLGHPQRSRSLEILGWAITEWSRDGWITPHNSFLHVIYRAGLIGIALIILMLYLIVKMVRDFYCRQSFVGGLLVAVIIYWLCLANFLVILELPYNAILFWSLFGATWRYRAYLKTVRP